MRQIARGNVSFYPCLTITTVFIICTNVKNAQIEIASDGLNLLINNTVMLNIAIFDPQDLNS